MELEDIPAEVRWEIATKTALSLSIGYGMTFRQILDEEVVSQVEEAIWAEGGKQIKEIADTLVLPTENAIEVNDAYGIIGMILLGKMEYETLEATNDRVVERITDCPNLNVHKETGTPIITMPHICQVYSTSAVEELNPKYTQSFSKRMCEGDEYCEYTLELKK
ncbi:MAG: hypothetical protein KKF16_10270 [Euryarchaeota archaeon]|nr:hypothetical protein [Euryarchaeota archaeon]MBU4607243.1 hypothetical protein [Euryarchaeota archaeon]MBV1729526.1 hypothetical protein [Methanobacterium sp.]MBV1754345.1 hypothetical protein [Methanobacterium sp.]